MNLQTCLVWPSQYSQAAPTGRKRSFSKRRSCSKLGLLSSGVGGQITAFSCAGSGSRHAAGAAQPRREWRGNAARGVPSARPPRRRLLRAPLFLSSNMKCRKSAVGNDCWKVERQDKIRRRARRPGGRFSRSRRAPGRWPTNHKSTASPCSAREQEKERVWRRPRAAPAGCAVCCGAQQHGACTAAHCRPQQPRSSSRGSPWS